MALPFSPNTTYVAGTTPSVKAQDLNDMQVWLAFLYNNRGISALYGNGADGAATLTSASTAPAWATKASGVQIGSNAGYTVFTLTRDVFFTNLTVSGINLAIDCGSFRIYVNGTLTVTAASGLVMANGVTAQTSAAPIGISAKTVIGRVAGGSGGTAAIGSAGASISSGSLGGAGGAGGAGGGFAGGAGGNAVAAVASLGGVNVYSPTTFGSFFGLTVQQVAGGGGGGGGGGSGTAPCGGGGAGALCVAARFVVLATAANLQAAGGYGAQVSFAGNNGGGGGGGGGVMILVYESLTVNDATTMSSATNCPGGLAGPLTGTGSAGVNGSNGTLVLIAA